MTVDERECIKMGRDMIQSPIFRLSRVEDKRKTKLHEMIYEKLVLGNQVMDKFTEEIGR